VIKKTDPLLGEIEAEITDLGRSLGESSGLFCVPKVLDVDRENGILRFERIEGFRTLGELLARNGSDDEIVDQAGRCLGCIHEHLALRSSLVRGPDGAVRDSGEPHVPLHGDYNTVNVGYCPRRDRIAILDWASAPVFGKRITVGPRYLDLVSFLRSLLVHQAGFSRAVRAFGRRMEAFLKGYQSESRAPLDGKLLGDFLADVSSAHMRKSLAGSPILSRAYHRALGVPAHLVLTSSAVRWRSRNGAARRSKSFSYGGGGGEPDREDYDYRNSHLHSGKGETYEKHFQDIPWRAFVWDCEKRILDEVLRRHLRGRAISHLDFACGTGRILGALSGRAEESVGADVSQGMLDLARRNCPRSEIINTDITRQDVLKGRSFELITAFRFFPNAQPELRSESIRALERHLSGGGVLVLNNHRNSTSLLFRVARALGKRPKGMSPKDVKGITDAVGLEIVESFGIGVLPATDKHMLLPGWVHRSVDWFINRLGLGESLAQNVIYVSRRKHPRSDWRPASRNS